MRFIELILSLVIALALIGCNNKNTSSSVSPEDDSFPLDSLHQGFVCVPAMGNSTWLGSNDPSAPAQERPLMQIDFTYGYSIGIHEVTQEEYKSLMGNLPYELEGDSLPVVKVTYYDAVLYANALSKSQNMDTAYEYSATQYDAQGNCIRLEGLVFHPEKEAYRLPTEAEWLFAANQGWNPENGWNASNSDYKAHSVCSKGRNAIGICDMAGNVMEWVNDWLSFLADTTVVNFAGGQDGGTRAERIVKGGYYGTDPSGVKLSSRGDVYTVSSQNKAAYVGFRLAVGAIPDASWSSSNGTFGTARIVSLVSGSKIKSLLGTYKAKLAFRNDLTGNLAVIDYRNNGSSVIEFNDTLNVYHPEISPDGKWVAFCTKQEGISGKSQVFVRSLSADSSFVIPLNVESAAIPRWRVFGFDTSIVFVDDAGANEDSTEWLARSTWAVLFENSVFGTPYKIAEGSFNGGITADKSMMVSGATLLRARLSETDDVWYNGEQACNVSLAQDGSKRTLFLDFGGKTGRDFVGEKYAVHERLFVMDSTGKLIQSVRAPENYTFDHSEWVNKTYAVVTLTNFNKAHQKIALVNMENSSVLELVEGDEIYHPNLWVDEDYILSPEISSLDPDSAGVYFVENASKEAAIIRQKLELFWKYQDTINTLILGSSRPSSAVDPTMFGKDIFAINMANIPSIPYECKYLFENYAMVNLKKLKNLIISLDIDLWYLSEREPSNNFFATEALTIPGYVYDVNHDFWREESSKGMRQYAAKSFYIYSDRVEYTYHRGMQGGVAYIGWEENPIVENDSNWLDTRKEDYQLNLNKIIDIIELAATRDINVVGVIFPQSPGFKKTGSWGRYGIRRSQADSLIQELMDLSKKYKNFKVLDENKMGDHDYPDSLAVNKDHLRNNAGKVIVPRIDSVLKSF